MIRGCALTIAEYAYDTKVKLMRTTGCAAIQIQYGIANLVKAALVRDGVAFLKASRFRKH